MLNVDRIELASSRKVSATKAAHEAVAAVTETVSSAMPAKTAAETSGEIFKIVIVKHVAHYIVRYIACQHGLGRSPSHELSRVHRPSRAWAGPRMPTQAGFWLEWRRSSKSDII